MLRDRQPMMWKLTVALAAGVLLACGAENDPAVPVTAKVKGDLGYRDTPVLPNQKWKVHDIDRPRPPAVTPGTFPTQERAGTAPSDAIVLFDGKDLSKFTSSRRGKQQPVEWKVANGYVEVAGKGDLVTKESFGDIQLHVEWSIPPNPARTGQWRGNSGIILMGRYEVQVLDSYDAATYADGQAGAIYGQFPPLVNPARPPGEWNFYDIVFEAPKFEGGKVVKHATATVFFNGVMVHNRQDFIGQMAHRIVKAYEAHGPEAPLVLQNHDVPVRYRSIWVRRLKSYDAQ